MANDSPLRDSPSFKQSESIQDVPLETLAWIWRTLQTSKTKTSGKTKLPEKDQDFKWEQDKQQDQVSLQDQVIWQDQITLCIITSLSWNHSAIQFCESQAYSFFNPQTVQPITYNKST